MRRWLVGLVPRLVPVVLAACGHPGVDPGRAAAPTEPDARQRARDAEIAARAAPFVDAFSNSAAVLAPDGRVAFVSTRDGLPQLYVGEVAHPAAAPRKLPLPAERALAPRLLPDGRTLLFLSDVGSDEKFHIFRIDLDGSGLADLTPAGELHRNRPVVARRSGAFVYGAHALDDPATRVLVQTLDAPPRELYRDPKVGSVVDVTPDGRRALFLRELSDTEQILFALDTASGALTRLFPPEGEVHKIGGAAFVGDGASVLAASEQRGRPLRVLRLDAATGAEQARYDEATAKTASIGDLAVAPAGDRAVLSLDAGDHSELRVLDPRDLRALAPPATPLGSIDLGELDADGRRLTLSIRSPEAPPDIAVLDVASGAITPLRAEPRPGLGTPPRASITQTPAFDGRAIPLNLYLPTGATGRLPTFVLVHGGPSGSAKIAWSATIGFWTAMGFAVVAPNIRGSTGFGIDYEQADNRERRGDAVRDIESVNRWARARSRRQQASRQQPLAPRRTARSPLTSRAPTR